MDDVGDAGDEVVAHHGAPEPRPGAAGVALDVGALFLFFGFFGLR